ncbi:MAG: glutathione S-transferase family protein [Pseudomonadota bacterium]
MRLIGIDWGVFPRRVTMYLDEKGITDIKRVSIDYARGEIHAPWIREKSPTASLPALELDDGSWITDSMAIIYYLEELYPKPCMIGHNALERAKIRTYIAHCNDLFVRAGPVFANTWPQWSRAIKQSKETAEWMRPAFNRSLECLETLADPDGPFLMGPEVTVADCALFPLLYHEVSNYGTPMINDQHPKLQRWYDMFNERPSAPCPLRDDGMREVSDADLDPDIPYWWRNKELNVTTWAAKRKE